MSGPAVSDYFGHADNRRISIPLWMVDATKDDDGTSNWNAAALLAQITWWSDVNQRTGRQRAGHTHGDEIWFVRSDDEWSDELSMSAKTVARARRRLVERGWVECRRMRCRFGSETRTINHLRRLYPEISAEADGDFLSGPKVQLETEPYVDQKSSRQVDQKSSYNGSSPSSSSTKEVDEGDTRARATAPSLEAEKVDGKPSDTSSEDELKRTFAIMWEAYPPRDGKRIGEKQALQQWRKLSLGDRRAAHRGAKNLTEAVAAGGRFGVPDLHRWLRDRRWEEWQEPARVEGNGQRPRDPVAARQEGWVPRQSETHTWKVESL